MLGPFKQSQSSANPSTSANDLDALVALPSGVLPGLTDLSESLTSLSGGSSSSTQSVTIGTLDSTDLSNPTRSGTVCDDYLLTDLAVGQQVTVKLNSSFDTYLQIINAETGDVLYFDDDSGLQLNARLSFTAEAEVDYIIRATSFGEGVTGNYKLKTNAGLAIPATPLSSNQTLNGTLSTTDPDNPNRVGSYYDGYLLTGADVGAEVQVNLDSSSFDTYLQVVNAATGTVVVSNDDFNGLNAQVSFTVEAGIDYIIQATSYSVGATGDYTLITAGTDDSSWVPIGENQTLNGSLSTTDPDNPNRVGSYFDGYLLTGADVGEVVQVSLDSTGFDTYLQVVNADTGAIITFNDDFNGLNAQLNFTVEEGIDYIIQATSYSAGVTGNYTITTSTITLPDGYDINYGYGLVDAAAAVADAVGESSPFPDVPDLGGNNWGLDLVNAPEVWEQGYTGEDIVVAVIDTGVDYTHSDLDTNIWVNSGEVAGNGLDDDGNGYIDDVQGWDFVDGDNDPMDLDSHGTHVAGTIAAENNGTGVTGVAYDAQIMPVRVLDAEGYGSWSDIAAGIIYAADNGADVINLSLGGGYSTVDEVAAAVEYAAGLGSIVVMASGNDYGSQPIFPANLADEWGIAVGAVDSTKTLAGFSNDAGTTPLNYVVAPGVNVYSTAPGNTYQYLSGTSMATPHVAGVVALLLSADPDLTADEVESIITQTANPSGITV